jgi:hypothetical protein
MRSRLACQARPGQAVDEGFDIDERLRKSLLKLRAWHWMSEISTDPEEVALLLTAEARELIALGRQHPHRAKNIGKLIVAYHKLIMRMKTAEQSPAPTAEDAAAA